MKRLTPFMTICTGFLLLVMLASCDLSRPISSSTAIPTSGSDTFLPTSQQTLVNDSTPTSLSHQTATPEIPEILEGLPDFLVKQWITEKNQKVLLVDDNVGSVSRDFDQETIYLIEAALIEKTGFDNETWAIGKIVSIQGRSRNPAFSPDGKKIAYVHYDSSTDWNSGHIIIRDLTTDKDTLLEGNFSPSELCWSPGGSKIAFSDLKNDNISVFDLITNEIKVVDNEGHWVFGPNCSVDGSYLAYTQLLGKDTNNTAGVLKIANLNTGEITQITDVADGIRVDYSSMNILFTADGKYLTYVRFEFEGNKKINTGRWVVDLESMCTYPLEEPVLVVQKEYFPWLRIVKPITDQTNPDFWTHSIPN